MEYGQDDSHVGHKKALRRSLHRRQDGSTCPSIAPVDCNTQNLCCPLSSVCIAVSGGNTGCVVSNNQGQTLTLPPLSKLTPAATSSSSSSSSTTMTTTKSALTTPTVITIVPVTDTTSSTTSTTSSDTTSAPTSLPTTALKTQSTDSFVTSLPSATASAELTASPTNASESFQACNAHCTSSLISGSNICIVVLATAIHYPFRSDDRRRWRSANVLCLSWRTGSKPDQKRNNRGDRSTDRRLLSGTFGLLPIAEAAKSCGASGREDESLAPRA